MADCIYKQLDNIFIKIKRGDKFDLFPRYSLAQKIILLNK